MSRAAWLLPLLATPTLVGCAVLTVDVDVYKGALANHESVQTEQIAAMAMGAKPLLVELRYRLERTACEERVAAKKRLDNRLSVPPEFDDTDKKTQDLVKNLCPRYEDVRDGHRAINNSGFLSRDSRRVDAVLGLYEDVRDEIPGILQPLVTAMKTLVSRIETGVPIVERYMKGESVRPTPEDARSKKKVLADKARGGAVQSSAEVLPTDQEVRAVRAAWDAAIDAWTEALRLLAAEDARSALATADRNTIWSVAWIAADLTSAQGLRCLLADTQRPAALPITALQDMAAVAPGLPGKCEEPLQQDVEDGIGALLAQRLADPKTGPALADQLLKAQAYAGTRPERDWFVVIYPSSKSLSTTRDESEFLTADLADLVGFKSASTLGRAQELSGVGLEGGRPRLGIETLIKNYLAETSRPASSKTIHEARTRAIDETRTRLFEGLLHFAEKVRLVANLDPLVRGAQYQPSFAPLTDTNRYVRVLEAVGNSIISQVDARTQLGAQAVRLKEARATEETSLRNAEARAAAIALQAAAVEIRTKPDVPDRQKILALLDGGGKVSEIQDLLAKNLAAAKAIDAKYQADLQPYDMTLDALGGPDVTGIVKALPASSYTTREIFDKIKDGVKRLADESRLARPPKTDEARRWDAVADLLGKQTFNSDARKAAAAEDRFRDGQLVILAAREPLELKARASTAEVNAIQQVSAVISRLPGVTLPPMKIPSTAEMDAASAKDVLDVLVSTLRYDHVNAVARYGRDTEIVKQIEAAVALAYAYRSGMIHIRPASAYLRDSYPATVLQPDPAAGVWTNMLRQHLGRQIPFADLAQTQSDEAIVRGTIDKQFWQRINQVRVAGAGRTNYVVAKDDVGNWYVKTYSADPQDIIKSAKNLALFSAGPALGANFLANQGNAQRSGLAGLAPQAPPAGNQVPTTTPTTAAARSTLGRQLDRITKRYREQTLEARKALQKDLQELDTKIHAAIGEVIAAGEVTKLDTAKTFPTLKADVITALGEAKADGADKTIARLNAEVAAALRTVQRYRAELNASIVKNSAAAADTTRISNDDGTKARVASDKVLKDLLDGRVRERQSSAAQYESGLMLIGETAGL